MGFLLKFCLLLDFVHETVVIGFSWQISFFCKLHNFLLILNDLNFVVLIFFTLRKLKPISAIDVLCILNNFCFAQSHVLNGTESITCSWSLGGNIFHVFHFPIIKSLFFLVLFLAILNHGIGKHVFERTSIIKTHISMFKGVLLVLLCFKVRLQIGDTLHNQLIVKCHT